MNIIQKAKNMLKISKSKVVSAGKYSYQCIKKIKPIYSKLLQQHKKLTIAITSVVILTLIILILSFGVSSNSKTRASSQLTNNELLSKSSNGAQQFLAGDYLKLRLQDISDQLSTVLTQLNQSNGADARRKIAVLMDQMKTLSSESNKLVTRQIQDSTNSLQRQLKVIQHQLDQLKEAQKHVKYLKVSDLPLHVISIDNIQQNNVVTIDYNKTTFPIEIGSYVAGWKLIAADFVDQKAEFINSKEQHVVVDLNRMESK